MERETRDALLILSNLVYKLTKEQLIFHHFLRATSGQNEIHCSPVFWKVLHKLLCREAVSCNGNVNCVKTEFAMLGYQSVNFYSLPEDQSQGSFDLLLALSWLISTGILDSLVGDIIHHSPINDEFPVFSEEKVAIQVKRDLTESSSENIFSHLEMCAILLKLKCYSIQELSRRCDNLIDQIHKASSYLDGVSHLTVKECLIFTNDRKRSNEYLMLLYELCDIAEAHILWLKKMDVFMMWIGSVCKKKLEDTTEYRLKDLHLSTLNCYLVELPLLIQRKEKYGRRRRCDKEFQKCICDITTQICEDYRFVELNDDFSVLVEQLLKLKKLILIKLPR